MRLWALVTSVLRMMKVSVSAAATSGVPPCSSVFGGVGGMGPSYQGPRHLGVAPSLGVLTAERRPGRRRSPSPACQALGTWGQAGAVGVPLRALGTSSVPEDGARSR